MRRLWIAAIVLAATAFFVYRPALNRVFLMDQIWYFAELNGSTSLADGLRLYDYAATRQHWKGDDALFRPALFVWLALGNTLFSYHHVAWNVANLALHVLVALALFRLLIAIRPSAAALPVAVLFTVLKPPLELVVWNHLGGYLLACLFLVLGLTAFVRLTTSDGPPANRTVAAFAGSFTIAAFCHEGMVPIALVAAVTTWWMFRRRGVRVNAAQVAALFAPVLLFAVGYGFHVERVARLTYVDRPDAQSLFQSSNVLGVFSRSIDVIGGWIREVALPTVVTFVPIVFERLIKRTAGSWSSKLQIGNALLVTGLIATMVRGFARTEMRRVAPLVVLIVAGLLAYTGIICLGRAQREVLEITYYLYPFSLLVVILAYSLVDTTRLQTSARVAATVILAAFILLHGSQTLKTTREMGRVNQDASAFLQRVSAFVDAHKSEPDFTFAILQHPKGMDPEVALKVGYPDEPGGIQTKFLTEILFARYYRPEHPKYVF